MNALKRKLAVLLTKAAHRGMKTLDPSSPCAKALKEADFDNVLKEDIARICDAVLFAEAIRILSLTSLLQVAPERKSEPIKADLKKIAENLVKRVENKSGKLKIPAPCRYLLLNL